MSVLSFAKLKKVMTKEEHQSYTAEGAPPGTYVSNMSDVDRKKWKAKVVGSQSLNFQIELRSEKSGSNLLAIVNGKMPDYDPKEPFAWQGQPHQMKLSANGPMFFGPKEWDEFMAAVAEAHLVLTFLDEEESRADVLKLIRAGKSPTT